MRDICLGGIQDDTVVEKAFINMKQCWSWIKEEETAWHGLNVLAILRNVGSSLLEVKVHMKD